MRPPTHLVIPDTQVKPGIITDHLGWISQYIVDELYDKNLTIIHLGDHWDMPSLSSYDQGKKAMEGRRYMADIEAGNEGFELLNLALLRKKNKPRRILLLGNHEERIVRAAENSAQLDGLVSLDHLNAASLGWEVYDPYVPVVIDGVTYAHYFYNPMTGRPYSGSNLETRLKNVGHSFTMGHQQGLKWGRVDTLHGPHIGLVAGSCYLHEEDYKGPQGQAHWRGVIVCHQVENGDYDPMFISLDYLCRRYEGVRLSRYLSRKKWRK